MKRVTGIGGVFFKARDPMALCDLGGLLKALREEGCHVLDKTDASKYGKFGWVIDPEDNKVELWQAPDGR